MDNTIYYIKIEDIIPSKLEPHQTNEGLEGLTISIQNYGIIEPLLLRKNNDKYEIVLGNRRYKAAVNLGFKQVPAIILKLNDKQAAEYTILDNIQRQELTKDEKQKLYQEMSNKFNIDTSYISNNLGIKIDSEPQSNTFKPKEYYPNTPNSTKNEIKDIINLKDLNNKELEREDFYMNNEQMNNNIVNTNVSNMPGVTPANNAEPSFGGRFFPSLEDEQTNMDVNGSITPPQGLPQTPNPTPNPSPLIDLTDIGSEQPTPNPQLEPVPNIASPNQENLVNLSGLSTPQPASFEMPQPTPNVVAPVPPTPVATTPEPTPNIEMPKLNNLDSAPTTAPFEVPTPPIMETPVPTPNIEMPNISNLDTTPQPVEIPEPMPNIEIPNLNSTPTPMPTMPSPEPIESKDVAPAINTIKAIVDTISGLGYKLKLTEDENPTSIVLSIEIDK